MRGTPFDIFGRTEERRRERALIDHYRAMVNELLESLSRANLPLAVEIAGIPETIRGYGHVKVRHLKQAKTQEADLIARWRSGNVEPPAALAAE